MAMFGICEICRTSSERLLEFDRALMCTRCFRGRIRSIASGEVGERVVFEKHGQVHRG